MPSFAQRQAEARARADAQRRRFAEEQQARIAEQRRRAQQQRVAAQQEARKRAEQDARLREAQRRSQEQQRRARVAEDQRVRKLQREQYTVKKGDTAATIAGKLGTDQKTIAQQTKGALRAGQVQTYEYPTARFDTETPVQRAGIANIQTGDLYKGVVANLANWISGVFGGGPTVNPAQGYSQLESGLRSQLGDINNTLYGGVQDVNSKSPFGQAFGETAFNSPADLYDPTTFTEATPMSYNISPAEMKAITDRTRDIEMKQTLQKTYQDIKYHEDELYKATINLRAKTHAALYAWETGEFDVRPDFFTEWEWEQLSPENKRRYQEDLGYVWDDVAGVWVPQDLEEAGYGMGGWDYEDVGYGGGGGGGEYKPPIYTGARRGFQQGNDVRGGAERLTSGYVPASHWRI